MNISEVDLKKLWAKAAGRCSYPGCTTNCIEIFEKAGTTVIGEMAHIIPQGETGPRATGAKGADTYENLILLCPTHHTTVDKAPIDFPAVLLRGWKTTHEENVGKALTSPVFADVGAICSFVAKILVENYAIFLKFGPESPTAQANPISEGSLLWDLRKCDQIIPNNTKIVDAFMRNKDLFDLKEWKVFAEFREHAAAFERNTYQRMDCDMVPRFPQSFQQMIENYAK